MANLAWMCVTKDTIANCFSHTGIIDKELGKNDSCGAESSKIE